MEVKQVISAGKLTGTYMSSWNNELQLTVEGGHEVTVKLDEGVLLDLSVRLNERIESIDKARDEQRQAEIEEAVKADLLEKAAEVLEDSDA